MSFGDELEHRPPGDPLAVFVYAMRLYAAGILQGHRPGPYRDEDARAYARALLIPAELVERHGLGASVDVDATAQWLGVPAKELLPSWRRANARGSPDVQPHAGAARMTCGRV